MDDRYEQLKSSLVKHGFVKNARELLAEFSDPRVASDAAGSSNHYPAKLTARKISALAETIDAQENTTPTQKYTSLLIGCRKNCVDFSLKLDSKFLDNGASETESEYLILLKLKKIMKMVTLSREDEAQYSSPVTKEDTLFAKLYLMLSHVYELEQTKPNAIETILEEVQKGNYTTKVACDKILRLAYDKFLHPLSSSTRASQSWLIDIAIVYAKKIVDVCDLEPFKNDIRAHLGVDLKHFTLTDLTAYEACFALSKNAERKAYYQSLYNSLIPLINPQTRKKISQTLSQTLGNLVEKSNKLYWRKSEGQDTINRCKDLLNLLSDFIQLVVQMRTDVVPTETELTKIKDQVEVITQKIQLFSNDSKTTHWDNVVALILVTLGQGLDLIIPSLALSETFIRDGTPLPFKLSN
jgi:hypothetical protein